MKLKILITGGAGFIGSSLAHRLVSMGHQITIVDNLRTGYKSNVPKEATFIELDIGEESLADKLPKSCDVVFHIAGNSSNEISFYEPEYDLKTNIFGTLQTLRWAQSVGAKKYIFASSMCVYGNTTNLPVNENLKTDPHSFYSIGKDTSENYIKIFQNIGLNTTSLRLFNIYGPGQNMANLKQGMLSIYMAYIAQGEKLIVKGSLERFRDFVYIDDTVNAFISCMTNENSNGKIYNVCTGKKTTVNELLSKLKHSFEKDDSFPIEVCEGTPLDQFGIYGDYSLINKDLGWKPEITLEQGITNMKNWATLHYNKSASLQKTS